MCVCVCGDSVCELRFLLFIQNLHDKCTTQHASMAVERKLDLIWVEAAHLENDFENEEMGGETEYEEAWSKMKSADGVVVPGGFGTR